MTTEREAFEAWYAQDATAQGIEMSPEDVASIRKGNTYGKHREMLNEKWKFWQAACEWQRESAETWQSIATAQTDGRKVIVFYTNRNSMPRTVMARWMTDEQAAESDGDGVGLEAGWYECIDNWDDYTEVAIHEGEPTHWMPLPAAPHDKIRSAE